MLLLIAQLVIIGLLLERQKIPPLSLAELPVIVQLVIVGLLRSQKIPPLPLLFVMVKPARVELASSTLKNQNPAPKFSQLIMQLPGPVSERTVIALPRKSMSRLPSPV